MASWHEVTDRVRARPHLGWLIIGLALVGLALYRVGAVGTGYAVLVAVTGVGVCVIAFSDRRSG